jgi:hypothetical protein
MATAVIAIYRYSVEGLSAEKMDRVALMPANVCRTIGALRLR